MLPNLLVPVAVLIREVMLTEKAMLVRKNPDWKGATVSNMQ